ncbi:MAG: nitrate reductase associated protein, partial [Phormidesmis sp.]
KLIIERSGSPAKTLTVLLAPAWQQLDAIPEPVRDKFENQQVPLTLAQWVALSELQRFALVKLSRPSHENNNFMPAVQEFGLVTPST